MSEIDLKNFVPRFYLDRDDSSSGFPCRLIDRRTGDERGVAFDSAEVVAEMVRLGVTVIEIDSVGVGLPLVQTLKEWGGITVITTRQGVPVG